MTMQAHLESLERKHISLEKELHEALAAPSGNDARIGEIKRRKLHVKDEMERLRASIMRAS